MHEYSIVAALIDGVEREVRARGGARVHSVQVAIGELAGVEIELLRTAFDTFRERSVCDGASLTIVPVAAHWSCPGCGRDFPAGAILRCADCNRPARLDRGDEILLRRIEMEVPDV